MRSMTIVDIMAAAISNEGVVDAIVVVEVEEANNDDGNSGTTLLESDANDPIVTVSVFCECSHSIKLSISAR